MAAFLLLAACAACGRFAQSHGHAVRAVTAFHEHFNAGQYGPIYDASDDQLKRSATRESFTARLEAVRRKLGDVTATRTQTWNVHTWNLTTYVTLVQDTTYANGRATERFRFAVRGPQALLISWSVSPGDLVLR